MVSLPELFKQRPGSPLTIASLDARHRVQRRSVMIMLEGLHAACPPPSDSLPGILEREGHIERIARLQARFYRLRVRQQEERQALIVAASQEPAGV